MGKRWVWAMAVGLVLAGGTWETGTAEVAYDLTKVESLCIRANTSAPVAQEFEISKEHITDHVHVFLKSKLPRLPMERYPAKEGPCAPNKPLLVVIVNLDISLLGDRKVGYYGHVGIYLLRKTLWETGKAGLGVAYQDGTTLIGPPSDARKGLTAYLDRLLTSFAAAYYAAGNP